MRPGPVIRQQRDLRVFCGTFSIVILFFRLLGIGIGIGGSTCWSNQLQKRLEGRDLPRFIVEIDSIGGINILFEPKFGTPSFRFDVITFRMMRYITS